MQIEVFDLGQPGLFVRNGLTAKMFILTACTFYSFNRLDNSWLKSYYLKCPRELGRE